MPVVDLDDWSMLQLNDVTLVPVSCNNEDDDGCGERKAEADFLLTLSKPSSAGSIGSNAICQMLSGIAEASPPVRFRLNFTVIGSNAWTISSQMAFAIFEKFPFGNGPVAPNAEDLETLLRNKGRRPGRPNSSTASGLAISAQLLVDSEEDESMRNVESSGSVDSVANRVCVKIIFSPVEFFTEAVPYYESLDMMMTSCTIFLADSREDDDEVLAELVRRQYEVENAILTFLRDHKVKKIPPPLFVIILHRSPSDSDSKLSKYHGFAEKLRKTCQAKESEIILHMCDFDDPVDLAETLVMLSGNLLRSRTEEDYRVFQPNVVAPSSNGKPVNCRCAVM